MTATIASASARTSAVDERALSVATVESDGWGDRETAGVVEVCDAYGRGGLFRVWADGDRAGLMVHDPKVDGDAPVLGRIGGRVREDMWARDEDGEPAFLGSCSGTHDCLWVDGRPYRLAWPSASARALPRLYEIRPDGTSGAPVRP